MKFVDLFAGLGGFHVAMKRLGHECVFASEIDDGLRDLYTRNFSGAAKLTFGDIRSNKDRVPPHDILCAGFPCQPFSKSGTQRGTQDKTRGTLFHEIVYILQKRRPAYLILENVGNFERHDQGRTWKIVRESLENLGYDVQGTEHIKSGGLGLISPHHLGYPHSRERFYVVAKQGRLADNAFPEVNRDCDTTLASIVQAAHELSRFDREETRLTESQRECIEHWNSLLAVLPDDVALPSFPIWGDEIDATYPYQDYTPYVAPLSALRQSLNGRASNGHSSTRGTTRPELMSSLPSYAQVAEERFPDWKIEFIRQNRDWFQSCRPHLTETWIEGLRAFPASFRKLEWNCQGEDRNLWKHVLQFRPSGLRVKRYSTSPSLVAMTSTQIPILGPKRRFLTRIEGLRLQGFDDGHQLPRSREKTFSALGNAVHVGVVEAIAKQLLNGSS